MTVKRFPALVLGVALLALLTSIVWTATRTGDWGGARVRTGRGMMGLGMMGYASQGSRKPVRSIGGARHRARKFAERLDLRVGEIIQFERNYYAVLLERDGDRATEVLVDPESGATWLEYGPAMMWNTRYGMMNGGGHMGGPGGMMGGGRRYANGYGAGMMGVQGAGMMNGGAGRERTWHGSATQRSGKSTLRAAQAEQIANRWLRDNHPGLRAGEAERFPGYYTLETLRDGRVAGMMSVNAFTAAVWYHSWHGSFKAISE